jgi:hypothetical protein
MAIQVVQIASANSSSGFSANFGSNVTIGNTIVMVATGHNQGQTITSSSPLYNGSSVTGTVKLIDVNNVASVGSAYTSIWLLPNVQSSGTSLSITTNSVDGPFVGIIAYEVSGLGTTPTVDQIVSNKGNGAGDQTSGPTSNITHAPEFIVGTVVQDNTAGTLPGSPWTTTTLPSDGNSFAGYQIVTSSGGNYTYDATSGNADWVAAIATIYGPSASAPGLVMTMFP